MLDARRSEVHELRGLAGGHRQRLLADDVPTRGQDGLGLGNVEVVRRGDMDDVHPRVDQQFVERAIGPGDSERRGAVGASFRGAAEDAANRHADPAQRLNVDGTDEPRPDHGGADAREVAHSVVPPQCGSRRNGLDSLERSTSVRRSGLEGPLLVPCAGECVQDLAGNGGHGRPSAIVLPRSYRVLARQAFKPTDG